MVNIVEQQHNGNLSYKVKDSLNTMPKSLLSRQVPRFLYMELLFLKVTFHPTLPDTPCFIGEGKIKGPLNALFLQYQLENVTYCVAKLAKCSQ